MVRVAAFIVLLVASSSVFGFEVGETVIAVRDAELRIRHRSVDKVFPGCILKISAINGKWIWVTVGQPGWLQSDNVVAMEKAIPVLTEMIRQNPRDARWCYGRGVVWSFKGDLNKAIADFDDAIQLDSTYIHAYILRGLTWHSKKEYDKEIADFDEAIRLDSKFALAFYNRGVAWRFKEEHDKAIGDFTEAIRLNPKYALAYFSRGMVSNQKREYDKAVADLNEALRLDSNVPGLRISFAWVLATCPDERYRDGPKAVELSTKACELAKWKDLECINILAAAYAENGNLPEAIKWQTKTVDLASDDKKMYYQSRVVELYNSGRPYREQLKK